MRPQRPRLALLCTLAAVTLVGGGWLWLRNSSLVAVEHVSVTGESGPDASQIKAALIAAARNMSTLDVNNEQLRSAVAPYPAVRTLIASAQFPHGLRIRVIEQIPVGAVLAGGRRIAVAADGTLLRDLPVAPSLPTIPLSVPPAGARVSDPQARQEVALLGAAPAKMLGSISQLSMDGSHGLIAQLRNGPSVYFGAASSLAAKWVAATEVLADPGSQGASYIDVSDPQRPAAGAGSDVAGTGQLTAVGGISSGGGGSGGG